MKSAMKTFFLILVWFIAFPSLAQKGFVLTENGKRVEGLLRIEVGFRDRGKKISVFEDKKDKEPEVFYSYSLRGYKVENAAYQILKGFYPFDDSDLYLTNIEARVIESGNITLLSVEISEILNASNDFDDAKSFSRNGGPLYILKTRDDHIKGVKPASQLFIKTTSEFFSDDKDLMLQIRSRKLRYENLQEIVKRYNAG